MERYGYHEIDLLDGIVREDAAVEEVREVLREPGGAAVLELEEQFAQHAAETAGGAGQVEMRRFLPADAAEERMRHPAFDLEPATLTRGRRMEFDGAEAFPAEVTAGAVHRFSACGAVAGEENIQRAGSGLGGVGEEC